MNTWMDVTNLIDWFLWRPVPSGIQRYNLEILRAAHQLALPLHPCAWDERAKRYVALRRQELLHWFDHQGQSNHPARSQMFTVERHGRSLVSALEDFRGAAWHLARSCTDLIPRRLGFSATAGRNTILARFAEVQTADILGKGDVLAILSHAIATDGSFHANLSALKKRCQFTIVQMLYDVIPGDEPELVDLGESGSFMEWVHHAIGRADRILTISQHSMGRIQAFALEHNLHCPALAVVPLGSSPSVRGRVGAWSTPDNNPYVLCVGSIEPRKNQDFLVHVWSRLVRSRLPHITPTLVLAGKKGTCSQGLFARIGEHGGPKGSILVASKLSDQALADAYANSLFTVFPSLSEGWGLPVSESLFHGRYVIASSSSSIPEVGGDLVEYVDPLDGPGWMAACREAIEHADLVRAKEARIRQEYKALSWAQAAESLYATVTACDAAT